MTDDVFKIALIQMNSGPEIEANLVWLETQIREAAAQGARFICTPENSCHIVFPANKKLNSSPEEKDHPALPLVTGLAQELGVWILIGSISIRLNETKIANRSYLINADGDIVTRYDKVHLFDVDLANGESYRESDIVEAGDRSVVAETNWGPVGLSICYDLRFPYLYRELAQKGARIIMIPAAFTVPTGKAHWEALLRARAIENGAFVLAPAQCGTHEGDRQTYGHSMVIGPWGNIIAEAGEGPEILYAELDLSQVDNARDAVPSLCHDRDIKSA